MKRLFHFKYPKIFLFLLAIVLAYYLFKTPWIIELFSKIDEFNYFGVFIFGVLFSLGFTAPFSVGFFVTLNPENILITGLIGGLGAMISNILIFHFIRFSFKDEIEELENEEISKEVDSIITKTFGTKIKHYLIYAFAGFAIASPLPNEVGDLMMASIKRINALTLAVISFILSTIGIIVLLWI